MRDLLKAFLRSLIVLVDGGGRQLNEQQRELALSFGRVFAQQDSYLAKRYAACSHKKGGLIRNVKRGEAIAIGLNNGGGSQYAVRKHQMMNGDIWVDCLRCGKKWRPPVKQTFNWFERQFGTEGFRKYTAALAEYNTAVNFETNNSTSSSIQCNFYDRKTGEQANGVVRKMYAAIGE